MFEPIAKDIFRWGTLDPESGIMAYSHLLLEGGKAVLIDPIAFPRLIQMVRILGEPEAIIMTNYPHVRGSPLISRQSSIPLFIPDINETDEDVELTNSFIDLYNMRHAIFYGKSTKLPLGMKAHSIPGRHEFALNFKDYLIVGDSAYGIDGKLKFYPSGIWPDEDGSKSRANREAMVPILRETNAKGLLSGHMEDIPTGLQDMI